MAPIELHGKTEDRAIGDLQPYDCNPKEHSKEQIDKIARSIAEFGFTVPLVIRDDNTVIMGHGRLYAARQLDLDIVPCIVRDDLTDAEARTLRIADNRVAESGWDINLLEQEISELEDLDVDLGSLGFDIEELEVLSDSVPLPEGNKKVNEEEMEQTENKCPNCGFEW